MTDQAERDLAAAGKAYAAAARRRNNRREELLVIPPGSPDRKAAEREWRAATAEAGRTFRRYNNMRVAAGLPEIDPD